MDRADLSFDYAAHAGRMVVILLFAANAVVYSVDNGLAAAAGMLLAIGAAAFGYVACSLAAYVEENDRGADKLILCSLVLCVLSGICFVLGA